MSPQEPQQEPDHPETAKEKADEFIAKVREQGDVTGVEKDSNFQLDAQTYQYMVKHKMIVELGQRELTFDALHDLIQGTQTPDKNGHYHDPIYVVPGVGGDKNHAGILVITGGGEGKTPSYITLVTEGYHEYGTHYLKKNLMYSDDFIAHDQTVTKAGDYKAETPEMQERYDALRARIAEKAREDGIDPPNVIISSVGATGAMESLQGTKYLMINQDELKETLAAQDPQKQSDLNEKLDAQLLRIKNRETSPDAQIKAWIANEEGRAKDAYTSDLSHLPDPKALVRESTLKEMVADGTLIKVGKKELDPSAAQDPAIKDAEKRNLPIYVVAGAGAGNTDTPQAQLMHTKEGKEYVVVNERYHKWTEAYAGKMQETDASVTDSVSKGNLSTAQDMLNKEAQDPAQRAEMQARLEHIQAALQERAKAGGVDNVQLVVDTSSGLDYAPTGISSATSKEGTNRIYISKDYLMQSLASNEAADKLINGNIGRDFGHELGHIQDADTSPSGMVRFHDLAAAREAELKATLQGSGPMGSRSAEADARTLENDLRGYATGPDGKPPTDKDIKAESDREARLDPEHRSSLITIAALKEEAALMKTYEAKFVQEHGHAVTTDAERKAETQAVLDQVMKDMQGKVRMAPEPAPAAPQNRAQGTDPREISPAQQAHIDDIRNKMGQQQMADAHAPSAPLAPTLPRESQQVAQRA